jgi:hypothetical protein
VPEEVRNDLQFVFVETVDDILRAALLPKPAARRKRIASGRRKAQSNGRRRARRGPLRLKPSS